MRTFRNAAALGLLAAASLAIASDVHDLTGETFPDFIKEHDLVLAEFFAPWCGHCKSLAPEYEEAATTLKEKDIALAKVDCTEQTELCKEYGIEGYPTLKVFRGPETVYSYAGQRKADSIVSYMTKQSLPSVSTVTKDAIEEFKTADKVVVVAYFDNKDKSSNETFTEVANGLRDSFLFGATNDAELAAAEGAKLPGLVLYKDFDEGKSIYSGPFEKDPIEAFVKMAATPLIGEVGPDTYAGYMAAGIPLAYIFAETPEERKALAESLKPTAEKYKGKLNFATIDAAAFGQHAQNLNLEVGKWPAFAIQEISKNQKFPFDQEKELTAKDVGAFVDDFVSGKMRPSVKSEPVPETQEGPVIVLVAHNFEEIVMNEEKDVLVEFYAPWCGHCKSLAPKYEELAALYATNPEVVVAKVDATSNDTPEDISGFPTIKLYPANDKANSIEYGGARTVEDLATFIRDNGSHKVDAWKESDKPETEDDMPSQAPAATEAPEAKVTDGAADAVKSVASEAAEAIKTIVEDTDDVRDEL